MAHVLLKKGVMSYENGGLLREKAWHLLSNGWIVVGGMLHVLALVVWLFALSKVDITFAYPFLALGYVLVTLMAYLWLGEQLNLERLTGMLMIVSGLIVISRGG